MKRQYTRTNKNVLQLDLPDDWVVLDPSQWTPPDPRADAFVSLNGGVTIEEAQWSLYIKEHEINSPAESFIEQIMLKHNPYCQGPDGQLEVGGKTANFFDWTDGIASMITIFVLTPPTLVRIEFSWAPCHLTSDEQGFERLKTICKTVQWEN